METPLRQILSDVGNLNLDKDNRIPHLVPGLEKRAFAISQRRRDFNQIVLAAYKVSNPDMVDRIIYNIRNELKPLEIKVLPYPFLDENEINLIIGQLADNFGSSIDYSEVISKDQGSIKEFWRFYLFIVLIPSFYYL